MRTTAQWLDAYAESHQHPINKRIHWVCVPAIVVSLFGLLLSIPMPWGPSVFNPATLLIAVAVAFYARLSTRLMLALLLGSALCYALAVALGSLPSPLWLTSLVIFVLAWIVQLIGHKIEGKKPSFFDDIKFLLIGPMWLFSHMFNRLGIAY